MSQSPNDPDKPAEGKRRTRAAAGTPAAAPSIATVARLANVSNATVSRVMNGRLQKVSQETRERVLAVVKQVNYNPSRAGSALRSGRSHLVALLMPDRTNSCNLAIAAGLERALSARGKIMVLGNTDESATLQDDMLREMRSHLACGIVLLGAVESPYLRQAIAAGEPVVLVNRRIRASRHCPFVGTDNIQAAARVAVAFIEQGFADIAVMHGPLTSSATRERVRGFERRFRKSATAGHRISYQQLPNFSKEAGYQAGRELLRRSPLPEAVFCTSDEFAYGLARACWEAGLTPGKDITVFGFDGSPLNEFLAPWLNSVRVDHEAYGPAIVELLSRYWDGTAGDGDAERLIPFHTPWTSEAQAEG